MRKLIILTIIFVNFLSMGTAAQEDTTFSQKQIDEYETQTRQMVKYLEGTLNFIGDPGELPADKDIIESIERHYFSGELYETFCQ